MPKIRYIRQTNPLTPTEATFPVIPTEVFVELNPELLEFVETNYLPYTQPCNPFRWNCYPRRLCVPRPCPPV